MKRFGNSQNTKQKQKNKSQNPIGTVSETHISRTHKFYMWGSRSWARCSFPSSWRPCRRSACRHSSGLCTPRGRWSSTGSCPPLVGGKSIPHSIHLSKFNSFCGITIYSQFPIWGIKQTLSPPCGWPQTPNSSPGSPQPPPASRRHDFVSCRSSTQSWPFD